MDALIILIAVKASRRAYLAASLGILGSAAGNLILFQMARLGVRRLVREANQPGRFRLWFHRYGLATVFVPAATPVLPLPLKFFVISAGVLHTSVLRFLAVIVAARACRYFADAFLGVKLGLDARGFLEHNAWTLVGVAIALAVVLVAFIRWVESRRVPAGTGTPKESGGPPR
jgi:membrane protein YqaA with SNARE-associated domain